MDGNVFLVSTGRKLPSNKIRNEELTQFPSASLGLIKAKTGVQSRYKANDDETTSMLATEAAKDCLSKCDLNPEEIGGVIVATSTPDRLIPATATKVAYNIGARNAFAFDINSVCSGSIVLLEIARSLILAGSAKNILVVASDTYSKFLNKKDFSTFPYFGDAAGCALLSSECKRLKLKLLSGIFQSDGSQFDTVTITGGGSEMPFYKIENELDGFFKMNGREVFKFATTKAPEVLLNLFQKHSIDVNNISKIIVHQANVNIIKQISEKILVPIEKFFIDLDNVGNTAGASVLFALDDFLASNEVFDGYIPLCSFGGGLTWGALALKK